MKRVSLAVIGMLLSAPSWAGGGHFAGHNMFSPTETRGINILRPHDVISPPDAHFVSRPHDVISPPDSRGIYRPADVISPPDAHGAAIDGLTGPLVKPAWKD